MKYIETRTTLKDKQKIKSMSKAIKKRLEDIVISILANPRDLKDIGEPEQLKHTNVELWSRKLTKKDRIVYGIEKGSVYDLPDENEIIVFYQYLGHYLDNKP